jgi:NAD(P)-dependent dehydrogenase (short-subunit alcohol dehydrogenase family)
MSKKILITGASGNLGSAVTRKMLDEGYQVTGTLEPGKTGEEEDNLHWLEANLLDATDARNAVNRATEHMGGLDAVLALVGGFGMSDILSTNVEELDRLIRLNFYTAFHTVQPALEIMKKQDRPGHIVLVAAKPVLEVEQSAGVFPYALSKTMVLRLAEAINIDHKNLNAQASVIAPSIIDTAPNREAMPDARFEDWVTPQSLADKMAFLVGEAGKDLRGTVLRVYGNA